jgi:hypothetical protein
MLDVHVVEPNGGRELVFSFPEDVHSFIFHDAGIDVFSKFAHLRRMHDYYADTSYTGDELLRAVEDIDHQLPMLDGHKEAQYALDTFRNVCMSANSNGQKVLLICD